jgi:hypothetical protein
MEKVKASPFTLGWGKQLFLSTFYIMYTVWNLHKLLVASNAMNEHTIFCLFLAIFLFLEKWQKRTG